MQVDGWTLGQAMALARYSVGKRLADKRSQVLEVLAEVWPERSYDHGQVHLASPDKRLEAVITPGYARIVAEGMTDAAWFPLALASHFPVQLWAILGLEKLPFCRAQAVVLCPQPDYEALLTEMVGILPLTAKIWRLTGGPPQDLGLSLTFDENDVSRLLWFTPLSSAQLKTEYSMLKELPVSAVHIMAMLTEFGIPPSLLPKLAEKAISFAQRQGVPLLKALVHSGG